jgi:hypothetical protein
MVTKRTRAEFEAAVQEVSSIAGMCRFMGLKPSGGNYRLMHNAIKNYNLDVSHFRGQGWNVGQKFKPNPSIPLTQILVKESTYQSYKLKNRLIKEGFKKCICESCGLMKWQNMDIPLELHHVNGDNRDNRLENLQLLCPNCHALTNTYRGKNNKSRSAVHAAAAADDLACDVG